MKALQADLWVGLGERRGATALAAVQLAFILLNLASVGDVAHPDRKGGPSAYGVTAGTLALVIEAALGLRFSERKLRFERLGKPHHSISHTAAWIMAS